MQRLIVVSILSAVFMVACAEQRGSALKSRPNGTAKATSSDLRRLSPNETVSAEVVLEEDPFLTTIECSPDLSKNSAQSVRLKMLSGSRIAMPLYVEEETEVVSKKQRSRQQVSAKPVSRIFDAICDGTAASTEALEKSGKVLAMQMEIGKENTLSGKFNKASDDVQNIAVRCGTAEEVASPAAKLFPGTGAYPIKLLIAPGSKMMFETVQANQNVTILLSCGVQESKEAATPSPTPEVSPSPSPTESPANSDSGISAFEASRM